MKIIHAVYAQTGSSISDSFKNQGNRVLVLNDESHHIFNTISGNTTEKKGIKRWKEFLLNSNFNFRYILGFTGTAYHDNEYFNDVIYRYSLHILREYFQHKYPHFLLSHLHLQCLDFYILHFQE